MKYIEAVSGLVVYDKTVGALNKLSDAQNQLLLVGSAEVVVNLMIFHDYIKPSNKENFDSFQHDKLLTELLKSMRSDLYKNGGVNDHYPIIHLTGKSTR